MSLYGEPVETNNPTGSEQELLANIQSNHAVDRILPLISGSNVAAKILRNDWDFIFIDGYHSFEQTLNDLENYWPLLRLGGILMLDDYVDAYPGVKQAWDEFLLSKSEYIRVLKKEWFIRLMENMRIPKLNRLLLKIAESIFQLKEELMREPFLEVK